MDIIIIIHSIEAAGGEGGAATSALNPEQKSEEIKKYENQVAELSGFLAKHDADRAKEWEKHEQEVKLLAIQQRDAFRRVAEERAKRWRILEDQRNVEASIRALQEAIRGAPELFMSSVSERLLESGGEKVKQENENNHSGEERRLEDQLVRLLSGDLTTKALADVTELYQNMDGAIILFKFTFKWLMFF